MQFAHISHILLRTASWLKLVEENLFLIAESLPICTNHIMTTRNAKGSHSAPDLPEKSTTRFGFFITSTRPESVENTPTSTINSPSTSYSNNQDTQHEFNSSGNHSKKAECLAFKFGQITRQSRQI